MKNNNNYDLWWYSLRMPSILKGLVKTEAKNDHMTARKWIQSAIEEKLIRISPAYSRLNLYIHNLNENDRKEWQKSIEEQRVDQNKQSQ